MRKLSLLFMLALFLTATAASDFIYNGVPYTVFDKDAKTCMVAPVLRSEAPNAMEGEIILPEKVYDGNTEYTLVRIGSMAFYGTNVTSVSIPESVTTIEERAFYNCKTLESVNIPKGLKEIGSHTFYGCASLNDINLPDGLTEIGHSAFQGCSSITALNIPESVEQIGLKAFYGCQALASVNIPSGITEIRGSTFQNCRSIINITLPESLEYIGKNAFYGCSLLKSITIPANVRQIATGAFANCNNLNLVRSLAKEAPALGENAFLFPSEGIRTLHLPNGNNISYYFNGWITEYNVATGATAFYIGNVNSGDLPGQIGTITSEGLRYLIDFKTSTAFVSPPENNGTYTMETAFIPEYVSGFKVTGIGAKAFYRSNLYSVRIPETVTKIGNLAFMNSRLESIEIPESVNYIGNGAFARCNYLKYALLPDAIDELRDYTFYGCPLTGIMIPDGVRTIGESAFESCGSLNQPELPKNLEYIGDYAFYSCSNLGIIKLPESVKHVGFMAFQSCSSVSDISIPGNISRIGSGAFCYLGTPAAVTIPSSVENIEYQGCAFTFGIPQWKVFVGDGLKKIGYDGIEGGEIYISAPEPPETNGIVNLFPDVIQNMTIYVQGEEALNKYKARYPWYLYDIKNMVPAESLVPNTSSFRGTAGDTFKCEVRIEPETASMKQIFWKSTNPAVATVDEEGLVTIVDYTADAKVENTCQIIATTLYHDGPVAVIDVTNETLGVEEITVDRVSGSVPNHIFNLQGVCLKQNATDDDIRSLSPGLYIIGGKKIFIR